MRKGEILHHQSSTTVFDTLISSSVALVLDCVSLIFGLSQGSIYLKAFVNNQPNHQQPVSLQMFDAIKGVDDH